MQNVVYVAACLLLVCAFQLLISRGKATFIAIAILCIAVLASAGIDYLQGTHIGPYATLYAILALPIAIVLTDSTPRQGFVMMEPIFFLMLLAVLVGIGTAGTQKMNERFAKQEQTEAQK